MAFVNEYVSQEDIEKYGLINSFLLPMSSIGSAYSIFKCHKYLVAADSLVCVPKLELVGRENLKL